MITQYLYQYQQEHERVNYKHIFVEDVHGDMLHLLIDTGTITLIGKLLHKSKYLELDSGILEYTCNKCNSEIYT